MMVCSAAKKKSRRLMMKVQRGSRPDCPPLPIFFVVSGGGRGDEAAPIKTAKEEGAEPHPPFPPTHRAQHADACSRSSSSTTSGRQFESKADAVRAYRRRWGRSHAHPLQVRLSLEERAQRHAEAKRIAHMVLLARQVQLRRRPSSASMSAPGRSSHTAAREEAHPCSSAPIHHPHPPPDCACGWSRRACAGGC
jgi:hypothetical protein